ncbi:A/G-specific adenine glycosylase [Neolewinella lacunae]|uniref:Adenine DNA glycosylase n=1 Tax=Neolewinella lacunae TaxID=1517758 RepID=A0A923T7E3_9BACT|nr:A/G-specific adenine glycosylase [Neolewinella lacunae]MBC6992773.1 A/G-specific adenine glycosylase [Neolewinella lacunae]MDN3636017.1 A/G-specific adenine glycosylase [Neolewinella lacunae]
MSASPDWLFFRSALLAWYRPERRPMPWKAHPDPYCIWLSEIILQQTRVEQGLPYYERFVEAYPTVGDLAAAEDAAVMKLWEGLGYYSRARNLLKAARYVVAQYGGEFPATYEGLLTLPGVGPYTAAAIASFAFGAQVAVLDGNVFRILARFANDATPADTGPGRKHFGALASAALGDAAAPLYNQAIMDFGALVCTPRKPACPSCPLRTHCRGYALATWPELPGKTKKMARRTRYFHYLVITDRAGNTIVQQRLEKDIWQELFQFPLIETAQAGGQVTDLVHHPDWPGWLPAGELRLEKSSPPYQQQLTHQTIEAVFHTFTWEQMPKKISGYALIKNKMFIKFAFPRVITRFLADKRLLLDLFS